MIRPPVADALGRRGFGGIGAGYLLSKTLSKTLSRRMGRDAVRVALVSEHASPLVAISGVNAGGQHVHVAELASGLVRLGHSVAVYTRRDDPDLTEWVTTSAGYEVIQVPAGLEAPISENDLWPYAAAFAERLSEMLRFQRPDVVHAHSWISALASAQAANRLNLPLLVTFHALASVQLRCEGSSRPRSSHRCRRHARHRRRRRHRSALTAT